MQSADRPRRRPRSGSLTPALTGLITFSFALLGMGVVAYASSLPSLVEASQRADEESLYNVFVEGLVGEAGLGMAQPESEGDASSGPESGEASAEHDGKTDSKSKGGKVALGGISLEGVLPGVVQGDRDDKGDGVGAQEGSSGTGAHDGAAQQPGSGSGGSDSNAGSGSGSGPAPTPPTAPETPSAPPVSAEEEERVYNALLAKVNLINGYVAEVNALTSAFNNDCQASQGVRQAHRGTANSVGERLLYEYLAVRDEIRVPNESRYIRAQGDLIRMYRLLTEYAYEVRDVWDNNLAPEPGDVNGLLARLSAANSRILGEFRSAYEGFSL